MMVLNREGILLIDKPVHKTSFYLVHVLRKITGIRKIGHSGTLDPIASGVMVMLIGQKYTRRSLEFSSMTKEYAATLCLGSASTTYDIEGETTHTSSLIPSKEEIEKGLSHFQGEVSQIPPMFSAKKVGGKKLYTLAREGIEIKREPVLVRMDIELLSYNYPYLELYIRCSKGTYVRSIAHDLGEMLGCFAHLHALRRTKSGEYSIQNCTEIDKLLSGSLNYQDLLLQ